MDLDSRILNLLFAKNQLFTFYEAIRIDLGDF